MNLYQVMNTKILMMKDMKMMSMKTMVIMMNMMILITGQIMMTTIQIESEDLEELLLTQTSVFTTRFL